MTAKILDGKALAQQIRCDISAAVKKRIENQQRPPGLAVILVGDDPASHVYVKNKQRACEEVGFYTQRIQFSSFVSESELINKIYELNEDNKIDGILVQLPLPPTIQVEHVLEAIAIHKDVDGFDAHNVGKLALNKQGIRPCTPAGVIRLLEHHQITIKGANCCVVGASRIVGRPMALELLNQQGTVTICHLQTKDLTFHLSHADIVVVAIGNPQFIKADWIKEGAVVVDVGTNRLANGQLVGDVDFDTVIQKASWITPVPGGVGPMTVAMLLSNTLQATRLNELIYP